MNNNFISNNESDSYNRVSNSTKRKPTTITAKDRKDAIYAAFLFVVIMGSLALFFLGDNLFLNNISISVFIISCLLLLRLGGPTEEI